MREFLEIAFGELGLDWEEHVEFDERYLRPTEVDALIGDASKAERCWAGGRRSTALQLARLMVDADIEALEHDGHALDRHGRSELAGARRETTP